MKNEQIEPLEASELNSAPSIAPKTMSLDPLYARKAKWQFCLATLWSDLPREGLRTQRGLCVFLWIFLLY